MREKLTKSKLYSMILELLPKRCECCGSGMVELKECSPDGPPYYFCNEKCYSKFQKWMYKKGLVYRALPLEKIE